MNYLDISPGIEEYTKSNLLLNLRKTIEKFPEINFSDSMSRNQVKSKVWLIDEMIKVFGLNYNSIFVLCGWYGILPAMIFDQKQINVKKIRSIDIDPSCEKIADSINNTQFIEKWRFKAFTSDILNLSYDEITLESHSNGKIAKISEKPDLIINTSCEHIDDFSAWISKVKLGTKVVLQSNNYDLHAQHTNCSDSLPEFVAQCELSEVLFNGSLSFRDYDRYMVIGIL